MTTLIAVNAVSAAVVIAGLTAAARFGYLTAGGRFDRSAPPLELQPSIARGARTAEQRRAA
jgi:hypothetical protein